MGLALFVMFVLFPAVIGITVYRDRRNRLREDRKTLTPEQTGILRKNLPFYAGLDETAQTFFNHRAALFLEQHTFEGREGLEVTEEIRTTIAGGAIHLTFGLDVFLFTSFPLILVYPSAYYSPLSRTFNRGETNPHGIITFSWKDYREGFDSTADQTNLGYHEFAHALILQEVSQEQDDPMFRHGYQLFSVALQELKMARYAKEQDFLRDYAFTNKMEFFAVCAETFMEDPQLMIEKFPGLYEIMKRMLCTDPVNHESGLRFEYDENPDYLSIASSLLGWDRPYGD